MSVRTFAAAHGGLLFAVGPAAAEPVANPYDFTGLWSTSMGRMPIKQQGSALSATYPLRKGRIVAAVTGDTAEGVWVQVDSIRRCRDTKDGSHYWGRVKVTADPGGTRFKGRWSYCDDSLGAPSSVALVGKRL